MDNDLEMFYNIKDSSSKGKLINRKWSIEDKIVNDFMDTHNNMDVFNLAKQYKMKRSEVRSILKDSGLL